VASREGQRKIMQRRGVNRGARRRGHDVSCPYEGQGQSEASEQGKG
jgi:hypothetical protein